MRLRRWVAASVLATVSVAIFHKCAWVLSPESPWASALILPLVLDLGAIAVLLLRLHESSWRHTIFGCIIMSVPPSIVSLLIVYGIFGGWNTIQSAYGPMLAEFPLRLLFLSLLTIAGVCIFRAMAHRKRRLEKA